jgi:hypothetical protein
MDKVIWGTSQAVTSTLFFLIQLTFLKSNDLKIMAEFSILFGLMNLLVLLVRRSLMETNLFAIKAPGFVFFASLSCLFLGIVLPVAFRFTANSSIPICIAVFFFNQLVLDLLRFSNRRNHHYFLILQMFSIALFIVAALSGLQAIQLFYMLTIFQLIACFVYLATDQRYKMGLKETWVLMNITRIFDFIIASGFGFFLPLLTIACLDSKSVGVLRTSQNFLNLGSIFTAAFYYSALQNRKHDTHFKTSYVFPSLLLIGTLFAFKFFGSKNILNQIFGPYFQDSLLLTCTLIVALIPNIWVSTLNGILSSRKEFVTLFRIHCISLFVLALGTSTGFLIFGLNSFGLVTIFCLFLEFFLMRKALKVQNV